MYSENPTGRVAWSVAEWQRATGLCHATVYNLLKAGRISSVKCGAKRLITTSPQAFIDSLRNSETKAA